MKARYYLGGTMPTTDDGVTFTVYRSTVVQEFAVDLQDAPKTDIGAAWQSPTTITPQLLEIVTTDFQDGKPKSLKITLYGPTTKKDGTLAQNRRKGVFGLTEPTQWSTHRKAPEWMERIVRSVLDEAAAVGR